MTTDQNNVMTLQEICNQAFLNGFQMIP